MSEIYTFSDTVPDPLTQNPQENTPDGIVFMLLSGLSSFNGGVGVNSVKGPALGFCHPPGVRPL